jgi:hypothetical protein
MRSSPQPTGIFGGLLGRRRVKGGGRLIRRGMKGKLEREAIEIDHAGDEMGRDRGKGKRVWKPVMMVWLSERGMKRWVHLVRAAVFLLYSYWRWYSPLDVLTIPEIGTGIVRGNDVMIIDMKPDGMTAIEIQGGIEIGTQGDLIETGILETPETPHHAIWLDQEARIDAILGRWGQLRIQQMGTERPKETMAETLGPVELMEGTGSLIYRGRVVMARYAIVDVLLRSPLTIEP